MVGNGNEKRHELELLKTWDLPWSGRDQLEIIAIRRDRISAYRRRFAAGLRIAATP